MRLSFLNPQRDRAKAGFDSQTESSLLCQPSCIVFLGLDNSKGNFELDVCLPLPTNRTKSYHYVLRSISSQAPTQAKETEVQSHIILGHLITDDTTEIHAPTLEFEKSVSRYKDRRNKEKDQNCRSKRSAEELDP